LFELDTPSTSGMRAVGLEQLTAAQIKIEPAANDVSGRMPTPSNGIPVTDADPDESALIDAEFAALANTAELEAPVIAAHMSMRAAAAQETSPQRFDTRPHTHVPAEQNFEATLRLPRPKDNLDARRGRLAVRYKADCAAFKVLCSFDISSSLRKELVELFSTYEAGLRAALPPTTAEGTKRDSDNLHNSLPAPGFDEHERALTKVEDRLIALDETISEEEFRSGVTKARHQIKTLLRYARVLAGRRFNVGFRRDRFEYLAVELLTAEGADGRLQLLPREQAGAVLHHLLAGLPQTAAVDERGPAADHMREALDRLAEIGGAKAFFDSEFFIDLHGYKISMRDHITCPEFLYLCAALQVELHNRMVAWSGAGGSSRHSLRAQLVNQQRAAEEVFTGFRKPRSTQPTAKSSPRPMPPKEASPQTAPVARKKKRKQVAKDVASTGAGMGVWFKLAGLSLAIVVSGASLLYTSGAFQIGTPPTVLGEEQRALLSPLLVRAVITPRQHRMDGLISRTAWNQLSKTERRTVAADLAANLKLQHIPNARIMAYKAPAIQIEYSTVVFLDEAGAK
jgi:hypothetical protein